MESGDGVDVSTPQDLPLSTEEKVAEAEVVGGVEERKIAAVVGTLVADAAGKFISVVFYALLRVTPFSIPIGLNIGKTS